MCLAVDKLCLRLQAISEVYKPKNPLDLYTSYPHTDSDDKTVGFKGLKRSKVSYAHIHTPY
jgi:hypothetical protein